MNRSGFSITARVGSIDLAVYGPIGEPAGVTAAEVGKALKAAGQVRQIRLRINSVGGNVWESLAIYNLLKAHPARKVASIDGLAASGASLIVMAADEITVATGGFLVIHAPLATVTGGPAEFAEAAELSEKIIAQMVGIYAARTRQPAEKIRRMMDEETWLSGPEAVALGFADRVGPALAIAASVPPGTFKHVPANLLTKGKTMAATIQELRSACPGADDTFLLGQVEAGAELAAAMAAWSAKLGERVKLLEAQLAGGKQTKAGVEPLGMAAAGARRSPAAGGDPAEQFIAAVRELKAGGLGHSEAVARVCRQHPDLHESFVRAQNRQTARVQDLIGERFALA